MAHVRDAFTAGTPASGSRSASSLRGRGAEIRRQGRGAKDFSMPLDACWPSRRRTPLCGEALGAALRGQIAEQWSRHLGRNSTRSERASAAKLAAAFRDELLDNLRAHGVPGPYSPDAASRESARSGTRAGVFLMELEEAGMRALCISSSRPRTT